MNTKIKISGIIIASMLFLCTTIYSMEKRETEIITKETLNKMLLECNLDHNWNFDGPDDCCCRMFCVVELLLLPVLIPLDWVLAKKEEHKKTS